MLFITYRKHFGFWTIGFAHLIVLQYLCASIALGQDSAYKKNKNEILRIEKGINKYSGEPTKQLDTLKILDRNSSKSKYVKSFIKVKRLASLVGHDLSEAKKEINRLEDEFLKLNDPYLLGLFYDVKGNYYFSVDECDSLGPIYKRVKKQSERIDFDALLKKSLYKLATIGLINEQYCKGDFKKAIALLQKESTLLDDESDIETYLYYLNTLGSLHVQIGNFQESINYFEKALNYTENELKNKLYTASELNSLGVVYHYLDDRKKSLFYFERALEIYRELPVNDSQLAFMFNMSDVYIYQDEYEKAKNLAEEMLRIATAYNHPQYTSHAHRALSEIYIHSKQPDEALNHINKSIEYGKRSDSEELMYALDILSKIQFLKGDYQGASATLLEKFQISDSLNNSAKTESLQKALIEYETEKKEAKIELLNQENSRKQIQFVTIIIVFSVVLLAIAFWLRQRRKMQSLANEVESSKLARAQINPHFLNNAFTNIQALAMQENKSEEIIDLTSGVSRFARLMLESTIQENWSLKLEVELLDQYCNIYTQKFPEKYSFSREIDLEANVLNSVQIPSALLQPIIENAFEYATNDKAIVAVKICKINNVIEVVIENSIGTQNDVLKRKEDEKSRGMEILNKRILLFNKSSKNKLNYSIKIVDNIAVSILKIQI